MKLRYFAIFAFLYLLLIVSGIASPRFAHANPDFLDPAVAFKFDAVEQAGQVTAHYTIAPGYYLYRERFAFKVTAGHATLGAAQLPSGKIKFDPTFNENVEIYRRAVTIIIPVVRASGPFDLTITSQGCADGGICYPPAQHTVHVQGEALVPVTASSGATADEVMAASSATASRSTPTWVFAANKLYNPSYAQQVLEGHGLLYTLGIFFVLGMALSLLPCTLPMIPIVSAIVLGDLDQADSHVTRRRGFILSLSYVLGMALVYTGLGVAAALLGQSLGAWLQNPWVLGVFAILLVLFAISMLGAYELQLPQAWQSRIHGVSQRHSGGKLVAVFAMGAISALVVGACMTAPLFGVLAFIAHTGNAVFGAAALFALGLGLGVPLLIVGTGAGVLLPRAGAWMESVKRLLGVLLLAVAIWIISPVIPIWLTMLLIALLLLLCAAMLWRTDLPEQSLPAHGRAYVACMFSRALGILAALAAAILLVGIAAGSRDPFRPLAVLTRMNTLAQPNKPELIFTHVKTSAQLDQILDTAHRPVLLDFYADWCVSCKEMEKFTFADPRVQARLAQMNLLRANVTDNDANDRELLKRFKLFGPPAIIVFDASGQERLRIIGYQPASTFLHSLDQING